MNGKTLLDLLVCHNRLTNILNNGAERAKLAQDEGNTIEYVDACDEISFIRNEIRSIEVEVTKIKTNVWN